MAGYRLLHPQYQPDQGSAAVPEVQTEPDIHGLCQQDAKNTQVHKYMYSVVNIKFVAFKSQNSVLISLPYLCFFFKIVK